MSNENELVSVIITTHGKPVKLIRAVDSVINQTYKNIEVVIVDDNGEGTIYQCKTEQLLNVYSNNQNIHYLKHKVNKNGSAARNTGISNSRGNYICFLDNDDVYLPDKVEKSVKYLEDNTGCGGVLSAVLCGSFGKFDELVKIEDTKKLQLGILNGTSSIGTGSNLFFRREVVENIGEFDDRFTRFQDLEYIIRVLEEYRLGYIDEIHIIKDGDGRNVPKFAKMIINDEMFIEKFKGIISAYSDEEIEKIYEYHYSERLQYAINCFGTKNDISNSVDKLTSYRPLTDDEKNAIKNYKKIRVIKMIKSKLKKNELCKRFFRVLKALKKNNIYSEYEKYLNY